MSGNKSIVSREFRVTITVEEVEAPQVGELPAAPSQPLSKESEDFLDEEDYSPTS